MFKLEFSLMNRLAVQLYKVGGNRTARKTSSEEATFLYDQIVSGKLVFNQTIIVVLETVTHEKAETSAQQKEKETYKTEVWQTTEKS